MPLGIFYIDVLILNLYWESAFCFLFELVSVVVLYSVILFWISNTFLVWLATFCFYKTSLMILSAFFLTTSSSVFSKSSSSLISFNWFALMSCSFSLSSISLMTYFIWMLNSWSVTFKELLSSLSMSWWSSWYGESVPSIFLELSAEFSFNSISWYIFCLSGERWFSIFTAGLTPPDGSPALFAKSLCLGGVISFVWIISLMT